MSTTTEFKDLTSGFTPVIDSKFGENQFYKLDLSVNNNELETIDLTSSREMEQHIKELLEKNTKKVAWGGYLEQRAIYKRSSFQSIRPGNRKRYTFGD